MSYFRVLQAFAELLDEDDIKIPAWFAFNSKDGVNVVSGDSLVECTLVANSCKKVVAVGINCTPPRFISALILSMKKVRLFVSVLQLKSTITGVYFLSSYKFFLYCYLIVQVTSKPLLIYPNSGETYDADRKEWVVSSLHFPFINFIL